MHTQRVYVIGKTTMDVSSHADGARLWNRILVPHRRYRLSMLTEGVF
jgi:hypothetical protein